MLSTIDIILTGVVHGKVSDGWVEKTGLTCQLYGQLTLDVSVLLVEITTPSTDKPLRYATIRTTMRATHVTHSWLCD